MRLAIDPGKHTGVAWRQPSRLVYGAEEDGDLRGIQWPGDNIAVILDGFHSVYGLSEIVIEGFRSRPGPAVNLSPVEVIGRVLAWADERGVPVIRQDPSPVKRRVSADTLRKAGGWIRGQDHSRDALRHLLYREERLGLIDLKALPQSP